MTSAEQVSRLLALVPYLQRNQDADLAQTAAAFAVSAKQIIADLEVLWYCGLPGGLPGDLIEIDMDALNDSGRIRLSNADFLARPMRFTPDEVLSLLVALRAVRELAPPGQADGVESALAKLEAASGASLPPAVALAGGHAAVRAELDTAIAAGEVVSFDYIDAALEPSHPRVVPVRLTARDGYGYLQAWNPEREGWRTYRLDRIDALERSGELSEPVGEPPAFDPGWLERSAEAQTVRLVLTESAAWIAEYIPIVTTCRGAEGLEVELLVADPAWLRSLILRLGDGLVRIDPPEAAESARQAAAEALAAYRAE